MAPSSSTRKAARLAQRGKGRRVRFQGGTLFPLVVAIVLVLGLGLVVYARASRPEDVPPSISDHWHGAYAFQLCGSTADVKLSGDLHEVDQFGQLIDTGYATSGVHSHDDGVIHWHAFGSRATGRNAKLGVFLDNYDVELSNDKLELPAGRLLGPNDTPVADDFPLVYEEGETKCAGEDATLKVVVWSNFGDPSSDQTWTAAFEDIPFDRDGLAITIAFVADDVDVAMPAWAPFTAELGALDAGDVLTTEPDDSVSDTSATEATDPTDTESSETAATAPPTTD